ncbi:MAG: tetratricopeptide repeat protein [Pseudobdellovibrionaceae bacterium]
MEQLEKLVHVLGFLGFEKSPDQAIRKIKFWSYEVQAHILQAQFQQPLEKLNCLRKFLFEEKNLHCDPENKTSDCFSFEKLIDSKKGPFLNLALLLRTLASDLTLQLEMIRVADHRWMKWIADQKNEYLDLADKARTLNPDEVLQRIVQSSLNSNATTNDDFKPLCFKDCLIAYLGPLEMFYKKQDQRTQLLKIYDLLLKVSPSSLRALSERALLLLDLGERKEAHQDLKRYFYLSDERTTNPDLKYLFDILNREADLNSPPLQFH